MNQSKPVRLPGPDHPITVTANPRRVVVTAGGRVVADSRAALTLREATYPAVQYIPRANVDLAQLERSHHLSYCPYKGEASYYGIPAAGARGANAVWTYESPHPAMAAIAGHLAFYPDRVDAIEERD